jgi:hypothetical protein
MPACEERSAIWNAGGENQDRHKANSGESWRHNGMYVCEGLFARDRSGGTFPLSIVLLLVVAVYRKVQQGHHRRLRHSGLRI